MTTSSIGFHGTTVGIDLGDDFSHFCAIDADGHVVDRGRVRTREAALCRAFAKYSGCRAVVETGTHSPWVSRLLERLGHDVVVANTRRVRLIAEGNHKTDRVDAEQLGRLGRIDPQLLSPVSHRPERAAKDLMVLQVREGLVRARTRLITQARGLAKATGKRLPRCSTASFAGKIRANVGEDDLPGIGSLVDAIDAITAQIRVLERRIEDMCRQAYPETDLLRQIAGVGALTALAFVLTLADASRFSRSRDVGAYLGLTPRQRESGRARPQLGVTKAGSEFMRRLLVQSSHYVLGHFGPDCDLRRFGQRLIVRGGKAAKKRALVAVARKLAVLLHRLWVSGEEYQALRQLAA